MLPRDLSEFAIELRFDPAEVWLWAVVDVEGLTLSSGSFEITDRRLAHGDARGRVHPSVERGVRPALRIVVGDVRPPIRSF